MGEAEGGHCLPQVGLVGGAADHKDRSAVPANGGGGAGYLFVIFLGGGGGCFPSISPLDEVVG